MHWFPFLLTQWRRFWLCARRHAASHRARRCPLGSPEKRQAFKQVLDLGSAIHNLDFVKVPSAPDRADF